MARIRVSVLGPVTLEVDGAPARLTPLTTLLLVRLVAAEGEAVPVRELRRDVWGITPDPPRHAQRGRNEVQKRVLELRRALDPESTGSAARTLRTEQQVTVGGQETAYRLRLEPHELDSAHFTDLVNDALHAPPATAVRQLTDALAMVRGRPLAGFDGEYFAQPLVRRLTMLRASAQRELIRCHTELGRCDLALPVAVELAREWPEDHAAAQALDGLRSQLRARHGDELLRHQLTQPSVAVVVARGDLFDQLDANLVVGFTDTFDTATEHNMISPESVQGQLVDRLFEGRRKVLDDKLRLGLKSIPAIGLESVREKPRGRRVRYPIGTTVPIAVGGRMVFATAYSRLGNDLVARSGPEDLRAGLEQLWAAVAVHGLFKPVAVPLIGSGLARVVELDRARLVALIIETFVQACRSVPAVAPELRIVLRPDDLARTDLSVVEKGLRELIAAV